MVARSDGDYKNNLYLSVISGKIRKYGPGEQYGPRIYETFRLFFIKNGKGMVQTDEMTYPLHSGDLFLVHPHQRIHFTADVEEPFETAWAGFCGESLQNYLSRSALFDHPIARLHPDSSVPQLFEKLNNIPVVCNAELLHQAAAAEFLYELIREFPGGDADIRLDDGELAQKISSWIEQHFDEPITVASVAQDFNLEKSRLHRLYKKESGIPVKDAILQRRIRRACQYLIHTDLSVSDISRSVGYHDVLYFSRLFHLKTGLSPTEYRKENRKP